MNTVCYLLPVCWNRIDKQAYQRFSFPEQIGFTIAECQPIYIVGFQAKAITGQLEGVVKYQGRADYIGISIYHQD